MRLFADIQSLSPNECVWGVTLLNGDLYVLWEDNRLDVYSTTEDCSLLGHITVPGLRRYDAHDMTSCQRHSRLYISDSGKHCIHAVTPKDRSVCKWKVPSEPCGLSVTPGGNLLVVCRGETDSIVELAIEGGSLTMHEIKLPLSDIYWPFQAVQLSAGQYVVCHRGETGLSLVDRGGRVVAADDTGLLCPCHVTIHRDNELIFAIDHDNHRVVMLNRSLQFVREVIALTLPHRLCLDHVTRRLYVGHGRDVTVVQLADRGWVTHLAVDQHWLSNEFMFRSEKND